MIFSRKKIICVLFLFSILLTGCGENKDAVEKVQEKEVIQDVDYCDDVSIKENEKIIYNIYKEKLGIYNKQDYSWHVLYGEEEEFAYKINGRNDIYTVGNSSHNHFSIMKNEKSGLHKVLDIDEKDSIMPFGEYRDEYYFIYNIDDLGSRIQRKIVKYNKKLVDVLDLDSELVASAVVVKDNIYYASYQKDKDYYELYQYNLKNADVQLILKDLPTDSLYNLNGNLVWNDGQGNILDKKGKVWCKVKEESDVDYNSEHKLFFCVYPNKSNTLVCDVTHAENGKVLAKAENFIGYEIDGTTLSLFCDDGIQTVNLKKEK